MKRIILKSISILISSIFLLNNIVYGMDLSDRTYLRGNSLCDSINSEDDKKRLEEGLEEVKNNSNKDKPKYMATSKREKGAKSRVPYKPETYESEQPKDWKNAGNAGDVSTVVGLVGVGRQGKRHLTHMSQLKIKTKAVDKDIDQSLYENFKDNDFIKLEQADASKIFNDPEVGAVIIATRGNTHYRLVKEALLAGKHVLVEKPFTSTAEEAKELVKIADEKDLILMVGHNRFYLPHFQCLNDFVHNGRLGNIKSIEANYLNPPQNSDITHTALEGLGYHVFYMVNSLLGKDRPTRLSSVFCADNKEKVGLKLEYDNIPVTINLDRKYEGPKIKNIIVRGEKFTAILDFSNEPSHTMLKIQPTNEALYDETEDFDRGALKELQKQTILSGDKTEPSLYHQMGVFINAITTKTNPPSSGSSAISIVETLEEIRNKLNNGNFYHQDPIIPVSDIIELSKAIHAKIGKNGGIVTIDGLSGTGKTTFTKVLADFYGLMYPPGHTIIDPLDEMRKPLQQCSALKKHVLGELLTEDEKVILMQNGWDNIEPGKPYTEEESIWYNSMIKYRLYNISMFFNHPNPNYRLTITNPNALSKNRRFTHQARRVLNRGDVVFVEGKYANIEYLTSISDFHVRLKAPLDEIRERFKKDRQKVYIDDKELDRHMRYYDLVILPSWQDYEKRTQASIDFVIDSGKNKNAGDVSGGGRLVTKSQTSTGNASNMSNAAINLVSLDQETISALDNLWGIDKTSNTIKLEDINTVAFSGDYVTNNMDQFSQDALKALGEGKNIDILVLSPEEKLDLENKLTSQGIFDKDRISVLAVNSDELKTILGNNNYRDFNKLITTAQDIIKYKDSIIALSQAK